MIITETFINPLDGRELIRTYSDRGMMIHGGFPEADYAEAVDPVGAGRTYTETDIPIEEEATAEEILDILLGGDGT